MKSPRAILTSLLALSLATPHLHAQATPFSGSTANINVTPGPCCNNLTMHVTESSGNGVSTANIQGGRLVTVTVIKPVNTDPNDDVVSIFPYVFGKPDVSLPIQALDVSSGSGSVQVVIPADMDRIGEPYVFEAKCGGATCRYVDRPKKCKECECEKTGDPKASNGSGTSGGGSSGGGPVQGGWPSSDDMDYTTMGFTASIPSTNSFGGMSHGGFTFRTQDLANPGIAALTSMVPAEMALTSDGQGFPTSLQTGAATLNIAPADSALLAQDPKAFTVTHRDLGGNDFRSTTISFVTESSTARLRMDTTFDGSTTRYEQTRPTPNTMVLEQGRLVSGTFEALSRETVTHTDTIGTRIVRRIVVERPAASSSWAVVSDTKSKWVFQVYGWVRTEEIIDPDGAALTSTWSYYQPGDITGLEGSTQGLGRVKQHIRHDGYESFHTYGVNEWSVATPYAGNPTGKVVTTSWDPGTKTETVTTTANGQILSKQTTAHTPTSETVSVYTSGSATLTTVTHYKPSNADFGGKPIKVLRPDGTLTTYSYTRNAGDGYTTITENGSTTNGNTVTKGTRSISITNSRGTTILKQTEAIGYGTGSSSFGSIAVTSVDNLGRALATAYHSPAPSVAGEVALAPGAKWTTTTDYNCCGVAKETDMYGIPTFHAYDGIQRQIKSNRLGVTIEMVRKGLTTETYRYAETVSASLSPAFAGTAATLVSKSITNLAGTLQESWSPDPTSSTPGALVKASSTTTTCKPATGLSARTVTTTPDNFTQITDSFLDGRTASTSGVLSPAMAYSYSVNSTGEVTSQSYVDGTNLRETTTSQSDWAGRALTTTLMDGAVTSMNYNSKGQLVRTVDADQIVTLYAYNEEGERTTSAIDLFPGSTYNDEVDNIQYGVDAVTYSDTEPAMRGSTPVWRTIRKVWYAQNSDVLNPVVGLSDRTTDGLQAWSWQIGHGPTPSHQDATFSTSLTVLEQDEDGIGTSNWTITQTAPDGTKQVQAYTAGLLVSSSSLKTDNSALHTTSYAYDTLNRPVSSTDSRTGVTTTAYLSTTADVVASTTDPGNRTTAFTYDVRGRRVSTELPDNTVTTTTYTSRGETATQSGSQTYPVNYTYDYAGRQKTMTTSGTESATTTWHYSATRGFLTRKAYHDGNGTDYTYTAAGRLSTRGWARAVGTSYAYDTGGRLISTTYSDDTPDVAVSYDCLGRQISQSNGTATTSYTYDPATLALDTETIAYNLDGQPGADFTRILDRSRDTLNRETGWELKGSAGVPPASFTDAQATYTYSPTDGRLASVSGGGLQPPSQFNYSYLPNSNLLATVTGPAHTVTNTWAADRNVLDLKENKVGTTLISSYDYSVNSLGQRSNVTQAGTAFAATRNIALGYDQYGQVISADSDNSSDDRAYQYDAIGNRLKSADSLTLPTSNNYTPNALNQYAAANTLNPGYDLDGNMTSGPLPANTSTNSTLTWDGENRLTETTLGTSGPLVRYSYDSQSRRITKTTGATTTVYVYDGWNVIAEYQAGTLSKSHLWGMDLSGSMQGAGGVGGLLATTDSTGTHCPTYDGNGNISEYIDATGAIAAHYEYDPFGRETVSNGTNPTAFAHRFSTKPLDSTTGLLYYGYRYYDPLTGRWPSRDPIGEHGGQNLYAFVSNNLINYWDYLGAVGSDLPPDEQKKLDGECSLNLEKAKQDPRLKKLLEKLDKAKCPYSPGCTCCKGTKLDEDQGGDLKGIYVPDGSGTIIICSDRNKTLAEVIDTLSQELVHAAQHCPNIDSGIPKHENKCDAAICAELQGHASMPQYSDINDPTVITQIIFGAASSSMKRCKGMTFNEIRNRASELFKECAKKHPLLD